MVGASRPGALRDQGLSLRKRAATSSRSHARSKTRFAPQSAAPSFGPEQLAGELTATGCPQSQQLPPARRVTSRWVRRPNRQKPLLPWNKTLAEEGEGTCRISSVLAQHISRNHVNIIHYLSLNASIKLNSLMCPCYQEISLPFHQKNLLFKNRRQVYCPLVTQGLPGGGQSTLFHLFLIDFTSQFPCKCHAARLAKT